MSHRRSFILLIVIVLIVLYLYHESKSEKDDTNKQNDETKLNYSNTADMFHSRRLLSDANPVFTQLPPFSDENLKLSQKNDLFNWKMNVNITKLKDGSVLKETKASDTRSKNDSVNLAVYVDASKHTLKELRHTWNSVERFLATLFGDIPKQDNVLSNELSSDITENNTNVIKISAPNEKTREGKFLSSIFNFGESNKENPPLDLGDDTIRNETSTEMMHSIAFITINDNSTKELDLIKTSSLPPSFDNQSSSTLKSESVLAPNEPIDDVIKTSNFSGTKVECKNCTSNETSDSPISINESSKIPFINSTDKVISNFTTEDSMQRAEIMCKNFINDLRSSNLSGDIFNFESALSNNKENLEEIPILTTPKITEDQSGVLRTLWKKFTNLGFGNERKSQNLEVHNDASQEITENETSDVSNKINIVSESSRNNFSIEQCKNFLNQNKSDDDIELLLNSKTKLKTNSTILTSETDIPDKLKIPKNKISPNLEQLSTFSAEVIEIIQPAEINSLTQSVDNITDQNRKVNVEDHIDSSENSKPSTELTSSDLIKNSIKIPNKIESQNQKEIESVSESFLDFFVTNMGTINLRDEDSNENLNPARPSLDIDQETDRNNSVRHFTDLDNDELIEITAQNESRIFGFFGSGGRELTEKTDSEDSQERIFIPNIPDFLNFGSGGRELSEETSTVSKANQERIFIPNLSNLTSLFFGSGSREIIDSDVSEELTINNDPLIEEFEASNSKIDNLPTESQSLKINELSVNSLTTSELEAFGFNPETQNLIPDKNVSISQDIFINDCRDCDETNSLQTEKKELKIVVCKDCISKSNILTTPKVFDTVLSKSSEKTPSRRKFGRRLDFEDFESNINNPSTESLLNPNENIPQILTKEINRNTDSIISVNTVSNFVLVEPNNLKTNENDDLKSDVSNTQSETSLAKPNFPSRRGARGHFSDSDRAFNTEPNKISLNIQKLANTEINSQNNEQQDSFQEAASHFEEEIHENLQNHDNNQLNLITPEIRQNPIEKQSLDIFSFATSYDSLKPLPTIPGSQFNLSPSIITESVVTELKPKINYPEAKDKFNPKLQIPFKFCRSARECNHSLEERCVSKENNLICGCARGFVRDPETRKCEAPITLQTSLNLPGEQFHADLYDSDSHLYEQKRQESIETMWILLQNHPELFLTVAEIDVDGFQPGSLVVRWNMKLIKKGNETVSELSTQVAEDFKGILKNGNLIRGTPLNIAEATPSVLAMNACLKSELNYCHENAICIPDERNAFKCSCKDDYQDNSKLRGEICLVSCVPRFCGDHGECHLNAKGERHCMCTGWYFGPRCEISGIVVISSFSGINVVIVSLVVIIICISKKKKTRYYSDNLANSQVAQPSLVTDAIALDNIAISKGSKFVAVSTPIFEPSPVIHVTSASYTGSSVEYDSTFDRSQISVEMTPGNEYDSNKNV